MGGVINLLYSQMVTASFCCRAKLKSISESNLAQQLEITAKWSSHTSHFCLDSRGKSPHSILKNMFVCRLQTGIKHGHFHKIYTSLQAELPDIWFGLVNAVWQFQHHLTECLANWHKWWHNSTSCYLQHISVCVLAPFYTMIKVAISNTCFSVYLHHSYVSVCVLTPFTCFSVYWHLSHVSVCVLASFHTMIKGCHEISTYPLWNLQQTVWERQLLLHFYSGMITMSLRK